ncbi:MAG: 4Fe-4S binding protein [Alistipes senegalensis]|nr:4Fe-4S binding protein [Bacteroides cellulosilyticus]MCM1352856.1 4Fe-4S binding protein [Alistipes senegalensis]
MKKSPNYAKHLLQWGVLAAIAGTIVWAKLAEKPVDVEKFCPFGGLQSLGSYWVNHSLACSMSMLQIMMGIVLVAGVVLFSKLFCGYLCPLGTLGETMGRLGRKLRVQRDIPQNSVTDKLLRAVKYVLLFTILYNTLATSELFCKKIDPYYAMATGFKGEIVLWASLTSIALLFLGGLFVRMFWCRYICPLGALSNAFKSTASIPSVLAIAALFVLSIVFTGRWTWILALLCVLAYLAEIGLMGGKKQKKYTLMHITRNEETCNGCKLCEKKCPYNIPIHEYTKVQHIDCTLCGQCISSCSTQALQVNGRRSLRWIPALLTVALFGVALWLGNTLELPTIDEKWGEYEQVEAMQTYEMEGLQSVKCFGSSKAFSAKMQTVPGVYGVKTFVKRHAVVVSYNPAQTDTLKIQEAIFTPTYRKYKTPDETMPVLDVVRLGVEGLHDRMDMVHFGMALQQIEGIYGFTAEFDCPVKVTVYTDPAAGITEKQLTEAIEAKELILETKNGERRYPMHYEVRSYAKDGQATRAEFIETMFVDIQKLNGRFIANIEKWGDDAQYPKAVYEMPMASIEKIPVRQSFPYFKSFLSCTEGIISVDFVLRDLSPVMRVHYVESMWSDERLWKEVFQAEKWTLRMADGTFKEAEPRLKFLVEGKTVR